MLSIRPMRVGYVLKMYPRFSETFILNEILAHEAAGLDLEIFSLRPPKDGYFHEALARVRAPVTYISAASPKVAHFWAALGEISRELPGGWATFEHACDEDARDVYQAILLARAVREREITHLHAHFGTVATSVARLTAHFTGLPYSFTAHAKDIFHHSVRPDDLYRKLKEAQAVVTVSEYNLAYLRQTYGLAARNTRRIYNGLDLAQYPYTSPLNRPSKIVAVGRLVEKKGFEYLLDACALLAEQGRDFQVEIIGAGLLKADLHAQVNRLGLDGRVKLLGPRPQNEVKRHVQDAAVFAAPCVVGQDGNRDGLPTVLFESMALGTPCISTDVTGIPEIVRDGVTGLQVPQRNPVALAEALARLLDDSALRVQLATEARRLVEAEFDVHRNAAHIREIIWTAPKPAARIIQQEKEAA